VIAGRPSARACEALRPLARLEHYVLTIDATCKLCVAQRTPAVFERASDIEACFLQIEQTLMVVPRSRYVLLVDTRSGPSRNDPTFEAVAAAHRGKLLFGFARNVAVAATAAGRLQIQRYAKADGRVVFATDSVTAAFDYLGLPSHKL
jgi:hypothetical protein